MTERLAVLGRLIQKECGAARNALPCDTQFEGELFDALKALWDAASVVMLRAGTVNDEGLDAPETWESQQRRAELLAALAAPDAMGAYGAPPVASTTDMVRPEPVPFDREAFRREAALRMLETEKGRYGAAEDAARSVILADALITALEKPRGA